MADATGQLISRIEAIRAVLTHRHRDLVLCLLATALAAFPLLFIRFAPLHDFPFHLARMAVLNDLFNGGAQAKYYELSTFLLPNVGMDAFVLVLSQVVPVETATLVFLVASLFLIIAGMTYLHRSFHAPDDLTPFLAAVLTYNTVWTMGFLNYVLGLGVLLFAIARHVREVQWRPGPRFASSFLWGLVLLLCHVAAFGLYAVVVAGLEIQRQWPLLRKEPIGTLLRLLQSAAPLFAVIILFLLLSPTGGETSNVIQFSGTSFSEIVRMKIWHATQTFSGHQNRVLDLAGTFFILAVGAWGVIFGTLRVARAGILALVFLALAFLAAPASVLSGSYLDARLPIAFALVAVGMAGFVAGQSRGRAILFVLVAGFLSVRSAVLASDWSKYDLVGQEFMKAFDCLPKGSILFGARAELGDLQMFWQPAVKHFPSLAVLTDDGDSFVPSIFAHSSQQPIRVRPDLQAIYDFQTPALHKVRNAEAFSNFLKEVRGVMANAGPRVRQDFGDRVFVMLIEPRVVGALDIPGASIVAAGELFTLYWLRAQDGAALPAGTCKYTPDVH